MKRNIYSFLKFLLCACLFLNQFSGISFAADSEANSSEDSELMTAFANLQKSMGGSIEGEETRVEPVTSKPFAPGPRKPTINLEIQRPLKRDALLAATFSSAPKATEVGVPLSQIDDAKKTAEAVKYLAQMQMHKSLGVDFDLTGMAYVLLLWSGSKSNLENLFKNILERIYSGQDTSHIRIILTASPIPRIYANYDYSSNKRPLGIYISAGMFASLKNVDELAGQLAKALARYNPEIYSFQEDKRFKSHASTIALINQAIEGSEDAQSVKNEIASDISAMERLNAGKFNPWALYTYEDRVGRWLTETYSESSNHVLSRRLSSHINDLSDSLRPIRLLLMSNFKAYLQNNERGAHMERKFKDFSIFQKWLRLRMNLFVKPFTWGLKFQVFPVIGFGTYGAIKLNIISTANVSHWALSAVNQTSFGFGDKLSEWTSALEGAAGSVVQKAQAVNESILSNAYLSGAMDYAGPAIQKSCEFFMTKYMYGLAVGGTMLAAYLVGKHTNFFASLGKSIRNDIEDNRVKAEPVQATQESEEKLPTQEATQELIRLGRLAIWEELTVASHDVDPDQEEKEIVRKAEALPPNPSFRMTLQALAQYIFSLPQNLFNYARNYRLVGLRLGKTPSKSKTSIAQSPISETTSPASTPLNDGNTILYVQVENSQNINTESAADAKTLALRIADAMSTFSPHVQKLKNNFLEQLKEWEKQAQERKKLRDEKYKAKREELEKKIRQRIADTERYNQELESQKKQKQADRITRLKQQQADRITRLKQQQEERFAAVERRAEERRAKAKAQIEAIHKSVRDYRELKERRKFKKEQERLHKIARKEREEKERFAAVKKRQEAKIAREKEEIERIHSAVREQQERRKREEKARKAAIEDKAEKRSILQVYQAGLARRNAFFKDDSITPSQIEQKIQKIIEMADFFYQHREFKGLELVDHFRSVNIDYETGWSLKPLTMMNGFKRDLYDAWYFKLQSEVHDVSLLLIDKWVKSVEKIGATKEGIELILLFTTYSYRDYLGKQFPESLIQLYTFLETHKIDYSKYRYYVNIVASFYAKLRTAKSIPDIISLKIYRHHSAIEEIRFSSLDPYIRKIVGAHRDDIYSQIHELLKKNRVGIFQSIVNGEVSPKDAVRFLYLVQHDKPNPLSNRIYSNKDIFDQLSNRQKFALELMRRQAEQLSDKNFVTEKILFSPRDLKHLIQATETQLQEWVVHSKNISDLIDKIDTFLAEYKFPAELIENMVLKHLMAKPSLIQSYQDVVRVIEKSYFWPVNQSTKNTVLEKPLNALLEEKRRLYPNNPAWKYDPVQSEKIHKWLCDQLFRTNTYPQSYAERLELWKTLTTRGVSTVTDELLADLMKVATPNQIAELQRLAVSDGTERVFDHAIRDDFALQQIKSSEEYAKLIELKNQPGEERIVAIHELIRLAQSIMTDMGLSYGQFLEETSNLIESTQKEAKIFQQAKNDKYVSRVNSTISDSRISMFKQILPEIKSWTERNQIDFILYLRGDMKDANDFIKTQYPKSGPERIRRMYQSLPLEGKIAVATLYLQETKLLERGYKNGPGRELVDKLVTRQDSAEFGRYSKLMLMGLLHGMHKVGDSDFQPKVISALIAMKNSDSSSIGEVLKQICEQFPGVGPKIAQAIAGLGLLPPEINKVLLTAQDNTLPPNRHESYNELQDIIGENREIGFILKKLLGSGSIKYSLKGAEIKTLHEVALQIFRGDVQHSAHIQVEILHHAIDFVVKEEGAHLSFLKVIVDAAANAVSREKEFEKEAVKTKKAKEIYSKFSDPMFQIEVPIQQSVNDRLLVAKFKQGSPFRLVPAEHKSIVARKILEMEAEILFSNDAEKIVLYYDTDRHGGNYLIKVVRDAEGKTRYHISPIDFGQWTSITRDQRDRVIKLSALAAIAKSAGANASLAEEVAKVFNIQNSKFRNKLLEHMELIFPVMRQTDKGNMEVDMMTAYLNLIAAINNALEGLKDNFIHEDMKSGKLALEYTDFMRAIINLKQYESGEDFKHASPVLSPGRILRYKIIEQVNEIFPRIQPNWKQDTGRKLWNLGQRAVDLMTGREHKPIEFALPEEIRNYNMRNPLPISTSTPTSTNSLRTTSQLLCLRLLGTR